MQMEIADIIQIAMLSLIIGQLYLAYRVFKADHERRRKQSTFEFVNAVSERYKKALDKFDKKHGHGKVVDVSSYTDDDYFTIKSFLSEIERICAGINSDVFDYEILKKMMASELVRNNDRFRQHINNARKVQDNLNLYVEFDEVARRIREDKSKDNPYNNTGQIKMTNTPIDNFKRALSSATKAISGAPELEVSFGGDVAGIVRDQVMLPSLPPAPKPEVIAKARPA